MQLPQSDNYLKDRGPTINKTIIINRHVSRRDPTTNQRHAKMIMLIVIIIIINIIMSMGLPNTPRRSKHAGGNRERRGGAATGPLPNHTAPQEGEKQRCSFCPSLPLLVGEGGDRRRQLMCPKASIRHETEKSREKEPTKATRFELSKIPSHVLKPTATRQFEGSSERRIGERERETKAKRQ